MKLGHGLLAALMCIVVVLGGLYRRARASVQPVYDVLSIDERIVQLRTGKFDLCQKITTVPLDKLDQIVKTCGSYLTLE